MAKIKENSLKQQWIKLKEEGKISYGYKNFIVKMKKYGNIEDVLEDKLNTGGRYKKYDNQKIIDYYKIYGASKTAKEIGCSKILVYKVVKDAKNNNTY